MRNVSTRQRGFTLIELLVVIAIIAILASILFPVFAAAREKARTASDASNIKQVSLGLLQYQQDYDESFPPTVTEREGVKAAITGPKSASVFSVRGRLAAYVPGSLNPTRSGGVWSDPSAGDWPAQSPEGSGAPTSTPPLVTYWPNDYGFNINEHAIVKNTVGGIGATGVNATADSYFAAHPTFGFSQEITLAKIQQPANFLIVTDAGRGDKQVGRGSLTPQYLNPAKLTQVVSYDPANWTAVATQAAAAPRHQGGFNAGYSDGHVKWRKPEQVWRSQNDNDFCYDPSTP